MKIAVLDDYQNIVRKLGAFRRLDGHDVTVFNDHTKDTDELARRLADMDAVVLIRERTPLRTPVLERLPKLRFISQRGAYPHLDVDTCTRLGIVVSSDQHPDRPSYATAELTMALMLGAMRRVPQEMAALRAGRWQTSVGFGLRGRVLGIYGFGRIGGLVAGYARAFGMRVIAYGRDTTMQRAREAGFETARSREAFFSECDVISLHVRLIPQTRGMVTAADLAMMKPDSLIVNTSRAGLVEPGALLAALKAGRPGMAGLDVFDEEPASATDPLLSMDNVVCTPHIGYVERDAYETQFNTTFGQIQAYAAGNPINVINPDVLAHRRT